ncbi:DUF6236 family protein [Klebsiella pneumoniae]|uniref:DUF6236 family protein n=1 Tax=Klebsiella pneumoniae TaxID=573 RepID=UPI0005913108|nr:DUF6236 family protein [Klebsiella pneumoniae]HDS2201375.1 hypothetical protein [Klebsiella pneumoniae subsp. pneumoniae]ELA2451287.1 hypothetical protein [Klebsiella pneumoniae]EME1403988.1 hypothetical protein [Klebsiella pneumoniae]MBA0106288.1 hypothetical protein [Klebsiella pneumoniae]MBA0114501.1 hypothetical protein [Klebsiella pneumoniae]
MENKIIVFPEMQINTINKTAMLRSDIDKRKLIRTVLFWDKIIIPCNTNIFVINLDHIPEIVTLRAEKILEEPKIQVNVDGELTSVLYGMYMWYIMQMMKSNDANYSTYELEKMIISDHDQVSPSGGELLTFTNAFPEPDVSTEINDILEFKLKRKDQLNLLMAHLNSLELRVLKAENKHTELNKAINEIDIACTDVIRLYKEKGIKFNISNAKFNFSMKEIIEVTGATYAGSVIAGLPQTAAVLASLSAGIASVVEIKDAISFKKIDKTNPFNYAGEISKHLC